MAVKAPLFAVVCPYRPKPDAATPVRPSRDLALCQMEYVALVPA